MSKHDSIRIVGRRPGTVVFAIVFLVLSVALLSQVGDQTVWSAKTKFVAQPRFWPAVGLGGMCLFGAGFVWQSRTQISWYAEMVEAITWARAMEFALWFMAYVWLVPLAGYLLSSVVFAVFLSWRMGYRTRRWTATAAALGVGIVVLFKSLLSVKIPGGAVYEFLPDTLRSLMILNF